MRGGGGDRGKSDSSLMGGSDVIEICLLFSLDQGLLGDLSGHSLFFMENAEEMLLPWKNNPNFVPIIITHAITFVVGLVGNIVVISAMSRSRGERSVTRSVTTLTFVSSVK